MNFNFWEEFFSGDNSKVNTMAVLAIVLAAPVVALSSAALIYTIFYLHKGLESGSVQLLIAMLTAATGGLGASMYAKSTFSQTIQSIGPKSLTDKAPAVKPDDPDAGKEVG